MLLAGLILLETAGRFFDSSAMADLNILRQIEQQIGQTFVQLEAEDFKKKDRERFKKQYAYALSPQDEIICLSLGTLYNQEILEIPLEQFQSLSILYSGLQFHRGQ
jgi:hypothetical protein